MMGHVRANWTGIIMKYFRLLRHATLFGLFLDSEKEPSGRSCNLRGIDLFGRRLVTGYILICRVM